MTIYPRHPDIEKDEGRLDLLQGAECCEPM